MSLATYKKKRNFKSTGEPSKGTSSGKGALKFVIHRHKASHLHYDFRLEMDGVLKSWAVPKGPSLNPADKRLAMMVEDHPYSYRTFKGVIPEGNYGAGIVEIWDQGTYECLGVPDRKEGEKQLLKDLKKGSVKVVMHGRKLKGEFALVKMRTKDSNNAWLLLKHDDEFAFHKDYNSEDDTPQSSPINKALKKKGPVKKTKTAAAKEDQQQYEVKAGNKKVLLTHPQKIYWPEKGITKADVLTYYSSVSKYLLPHLKDRPQSLHRTPSGIKDKGFFQKNMDMDLPEWVKTKAMYSESADKDIHYVICNDVATLLFLNNLGCIELNPWNSRLSNPDKPDYLVIDIDPSEKNTFDQVIETAKVVHELLQKAGAAAYCKTSGATGMHIYMPLNARFDYDTVKTFAQLIASYTVEALPDMTTIERSLKKRSKEHIYIDFLQNRQGQTLASAYSVRPVPAATVSAPLDWKELRKGLSPERFDMKTMPKRLAQKGDLFKPVLGKGVDLLKCLRNLKGGL